MQRTCKILDFQEKQSTQLTAGVCCWEPFGCRHTPHCTAWGHSLAGHEAHVALLVWYWSKHTQTHIFSKCIQLIMYMATLPWLPWWVGQMSTYLLGTWARWVNIWLQCSALTSYSCGNLKASYKCPVSGLEDSFGLKLLKLSSRVFYNGLFI